MKLRALAAVCVLALAASHASAQYTKRGVRYLSSVPLSVFPGAPSSGSAIISYTSPSGREYAIMGATNGKHFFDITDPSTPIQVGFVATPAGSLWQEMCTVGEFCYGVSEHSATQIIDLRQIDSGIVTHMGTWNHAWFDSEAAVTRTLQNRAHTAQGSARSNTVFINGARDSASPVKYYMIALNVSNPSAPYVSGYWSMYDPDSKNSSKIVYVHDCTLQYYDSGPYAGKEIMFAACGYDGLYILDVTDPSNMVLLSKYTYLPANTYAHSGSLTPDKKHFYLNDEFDEAYGGASNTTHIFNIENLAAPVYVGADNHGGNFIDHNSIVQDNKFLVSSYAGGLRIFDFTTQTNLNEVGYFDTLPATDYKDYVANWGVAGNLSSGNVVLSDMQAGLFVLDPSEALGFGAVPVSDLVTRGTRSGTFGDSRRSDDKRITYQGTNAGLVAQMSLETTHLPVGSNGTLKLEAMSANSPVQLTVQIQRVSDGKWINMGKFTLGSADQTFSVGVAGLTSYATAGGVINLRLTLPKKARGATGDPGVKIDALNFIVP